MVDNLESEHPGFETRFETVPETVQMAKTGSEQLENLESGILLGGSSQDLKVVNTHG